MADLDGPYDVPSGDGDDAAAANTPDEAEAATTDADDADSPDVSIEHEGAGGSTEC